MMQINWFDLCFVIFFIFFLTKVLSCCVLNWVGLYVVTADFSFNFSKDLGAKYGSNYVEKGDKRLQEKNVNIAFSWKGSYSLVFLLV